MFTQNRRTKITSVSALSAANRTTPAFGNNIVEQMPVNKAPEAKNDTVEIKKENTAQPPKISRLRLFTRILRNDQIKAINESRMLPENAKFETYTGNRQIIANNWLNVTQGTRKLLPGFEVQKFLGFAVVVPEDSKGLFLKKV